MSKMVERVAQVIFRSHDPVSRDDARDVARAVIAAMREPTEAMVATVWIDSPYGSETICSIYRAMIDAALQ